MPKTLQYQQLAREIPFGFMLREFVPGAANPGTTASVRLHNVSGPGGDAVDSYGVLIGIAGQNGVTYTIADDSGAAGTNWEVMVSRTGAGTFAAIARLLYAGPAGLNNMTVTVTASSSVKFGVAGIVWSHSFFDPGTNLDFTDSNVDGAGTSHACAAGGHNTGTGGSFTFAVSCPASDPGAITPAAGFNLLPSSNGLVLFQYATPIVPATLSSTTGAWTSANSPAESTGVIASFSFRATPDQFTQAIQPVTQTVRRAVVRPDPGFIAWAPQTINVTAPPTWGWEPQFVDLTFPRKPAFSGQSEQIDPTSYIKQNLGWLVQHPNAPPKTRVPDPGYFVQPEIWPVPADHTFVMVIWSDVSLGVPGFTNESLTVAGFTGESLIN